MFQVWACKQVLGIAHTNGTVSKWDPNIDPRCPSCQQCTETTSHVLLCDEVGRVDALLRSIDLLETWLHSVGTDPLLTDCIIQYARGRGAVSMQSLCVLLDARFRGMALSQDTIGWQRFMEGMISRGVVEIQRHYLYTHGLLYKLNRWASGIIIKLLEITNVQWLYRNIVVHDKVAGSLAVLNKDGILAEIESQRGLLDEHKYLLEVNLDNIDSTDGSHQEYWLLAIRAARIACAAHSDVEFQNLPQLCSQRPQHQMGTIMVRCSSPCRGQG